MKKVIAWFVGAFVMPPVVWLLTAWFLGLWDFQEMLLIVLSPVIWIYVGLFVAGLFFEVRRRLKPVSVCVAGDHDPDCIRSAQRSIARLPRFFLIMMTIYTVFGTYVVLLGQPFIDTLEYVFAFMLGVPIIFLFAILFFIQMVAALDECSREVPLPTDISGITLNFKLVSIFLFNVLGLILVFITGALSTVYKTPPETLFAVMVNRLSVIGAGGIIFTAVNLWLLSRQITTPINRTSRTVQVLAEGDLSRQIEIPSRDEIGFLGRSFNQAMHSLSGMIRGIKNQADVGTGIGEELKETSENAAMALNAISEKVSVIQREIRSLGEEIRVSGKGVEEVRTFVERVERLIEDQNTTIQASTDTISTMIESIDEIVNLVGNNRSRTQELESYASRGEAEMSEHHKAITMVVQSAGSIMDMLTVINKIAAQTNLLAMNAAIEAAHAGDYGMGFSVVAQEIRTLAENAAENAKKVGLSLKEVIEKIKVSEESVVRTEGIFGQIVSEIGSTVEGISRVYTSVQQLSDNSGSVNRALEELVSQTGEVTVGARRVSEQIASVSAAMVNVQTLTGTVETGTTEITQRVEDLNETVNTVAEAGRRNAATVRELEQLAGRFVVNGEGAY